MVTLSSLREGAGVVVEEFAAGVDEVVGVAVVAGEGVIVDVVVVCASWL